MTQKELAELVMDKAGSLGRGVDFFVFQKPGEFYIFFFTTRMASKVLPALKRLALNPEVSFNMTNARYLKKKLIEE
jgi:hypothetical protein